MSKGYQVLPEIYDRWQQSYGKDFSSLILPKLLHTINIYKIPKSSHLDLACGTGTLALMMAKRGWDVLALDVSEGMIREGIQKVRNGRLSIKFTRQDMRSFSVPRQVGLVTCMFDAINHLTSSRDLLRCFRNVHKALTPGGYFAFDVNNEFCYMTVWRQTDVIHETDFSLILQNSFNAITKQAKSNVTLFLLQGRGFTKKTETVRERYYSNDEVGGLLRIAGFTVLESNDFNFTSDPIVGEIKTWWVARK